MRWSYKTVHYEFKKEGLLGSAFIDEAEIEESLNQFGREGWELISLLDMRDGVIAVFKQPLVNSVKKDFEELVEGDEELLAEAESRAFDYLPAREIGHGDIASPVETYAVEPDKAVEVEEVYNKDDDDQVSETEIGAIRIE